MYAHHPLHSPTRSAIILAHHPLGADLQHLQPFDNSLRTRIAFRNPIRKRFHSFQSLIALERSLPTLPLADAFIFQPTWFTTCEETIQTLQLIARHQPHASRVILDASDPTSSPLFPASEHAHLFLKKQLLANLDLYSSPTAANWCFADYCANVLHWPIHSYHFGSILAPSQSSKLRLTWNIGASHHFSRMALFETLRRSLYLYRPLAKRPISVHCRVGIGGKHSFYAQHRLLAVQIADRFPNSRTSVHHEGQTPPLSPRAFRSELRHSQIALSPFGWGEICFRDFEAVLAGAVLIKPDMSHLQTEPNIYIPNETYIPCRWDLQDLPDQIARCQKDLAWAQSIADRAFTAYSNYFKNNQWTNRVTSFWQSLAPSAN